MTYSLVAVCLWAALANVIAMFPSKRQHWPAAYVLIIIGIPLVGWVTYENGPWVGLIVLAAGASLLRWPVIYLWRWTKRRAALAPKEPAE
jgi:membrane protease YdiL (CAAX protease family)